MFRIFMKVYQYKKCGTCRKATKQLDQAGITYQSIPIREQPPTKAELRKAIKLLGKRAVCNRSGKDYREMGLSKKIDDMTVSDLVELLHANGNLVKRPFIVDGEKITVGFTQKV